MDRTEYIVASIVALSLVVNLPHPSFLVLILADAILLFCGALFYLKTLVTVEGERPYLWSIAFVPISLAPAGYFNDLNTLIGFATIATFMVFRTIAVFIHNWKIRIGLQRKHQIQEISKALLSTIRDERIDFSNGRFVYNEEIRKLLLESFDKAVHEVDIVSPWVNKIATNHDLLVRMERALQRKVKIQIVYGIMGNSELADNRLARSKSVMAELQKRFQEHGEFFSTRLDNTHEKLLLCDENFMAFGSCNLLSFDGKYDKPNTRNEMMYYSENPEHIRQTRKRYFS